MSLCVRGVCGVCVCVCAYTGLGGEGCTCVFGVCVDGKDGWCSNKESLISHQHTVTRRFISI